MTAKLFHGGTFRPEERAFVLSSAGITCKDHLGVLIPRAALEEFDFMCDWVIVEWEEPGGMTRTRASFKLVRMLGENDYCNGWSVCVPKRLFEVVP